MAENSSEDVLKICLVGGGEVGSYLLEIFADMDSVSIAGVADKDPEAPGMQVARQNNIRTTEDMDELIKKPAIDVILEVTGSEKVLEYIHENKTGGAEVISGEGSFLIYEIIESFRASQRQLIENMVENLEEVNQQIEGNSQQVDSLLAEIKNIAKSLDILSLNASIEAARASGSQGFSVVAEEVRKLSGESGELVADIEEVNSDIINLNREIQENIKEFREEFEKAGQSD